MNRWRVLRGLLAYAAIVLFCLAVWAAVVALYLTVGWISVVTLVVVGLVVYEVVFTDWPYPDDRAWLDADEMGRPVRLEDAA